MIPHQFTILIVEDQDLMRRMLRELLQSAYPHALILDADSAERALELFESHRPQVVLMDVKLPGTNGVVLSSRLKALLPDTVIIVISQYSAQVYIERAMSAGAFAYITKDVMYRQLLPTLARALEPRAQPPGPEQAE
jgi:two-component system response regulator DegU